MIQIIHSHTRRERESRTDNAFLSQSRRFCLGCRSRPRERASFVAHTRFVVVVVVATTVLRPALFFLFFCSCCFGGGTMQLTLAIYVVRP